MNLSNVAFEPDSRLRTLEAFVFSGCSSLLWISLPARLEHISASIVARSGMCWLSIDEHNPFFGIDDDCVIDSEGQVVLVVAPDELPFNASDPTIG
jgi:hypothetical protein